MLDTPDQLASFGDYQAAGGFKKPGSYAVASSNKSTAQSLSESLKGSIDPELNYQKDGIQELPDLINRLAAECDAVTPASDAWTEYLDKAAKPDDLMQVSIGVDVLRKMSGAPEDEPAASTRPITDGQAVTNNKAAIAKVSAVKSAVLRLMANINTAITPPPAPTGSGTGGGGAGGTLPPPPLPADLKQQAMSMIDKLRPLRGQVQSTSNKVSSQASAASSERTKALKAFEDAVSFTIIDSNKKNPKISDAINAIAP